MCVGFGLDWNVRRVTEGVFRYFELLGFSWNFGGCGNSGFRLRGTV